MSVRIDVEYEGDLHCTAIHGPSGDRLPTDAPVDNEGRGEHFSPTDLVATALGTCVLTVMGIAARRNGWDMSGSRASVTKEMGAEPRRHIRRIDCHVVLPASLDERARRVLEAAARACPVTASLGPTTRVDVTFDYRL
jgi:putative redox protein